jgi:hypothetical protein
MMLMRPNALGFTWLAASAALFFTACGDSEPLACEFDSTYAAIQQTIFEARGCTQSVCHGDAQQGGLDLRAPASHSALVRASSEIDPEIQRVFPGDETLSLLYLKLSAKVDGTSLGALGQPMPNGAGALSDDQLSAIRKWIRGGASEQGIVEGTLPLLGCAEDLAADPNKIVPLPPPDPELGVQLYSGGWGLDAQAESEVCFVTYYDLTDVVPSEFVVPCADSFEGSEARQCFAFRRNELAQDGQSHHSIITVYTPESDPLGGDWGPWTCLGGEREGRACDPTQADECGARGACTTPVLPSIGCVAYAAAPDDFASFGAAALGGVSGTRVQLTGAQESSFIDEPPAGVYSLLPLKGFVGWNSHAFNLTEKPTTVEQWVNLSFAPEDERQALRRQIFEAREIFAMGPVAPFTKKEICHSFTLPQYSRLLSLSSHMHKRGERYRIWLPPQEACNGTANCDVPDGPADYESVLYNDPLYLSYEPPVELDGAAETDRTFRACAVYDNGKDNPAEVKRESNKPNTPTCGLPFVGCGCDPEERYCLFGENQGMACGGDDAVCGSGVCDACDLKGGTTTDDEMFISLGSYFIAGP